MGTPLEVESALLIVSASPQLVADVISRVPGAGEFAFLEPTLQRIRDTYLDMPGRPLGTKRIAFRLREIDGSRFLTFKADTPPASGPTKRIELEEAWSLTALRRVRAELTSRGIRMEGEETVRSSPDPLETLGSMGFEAVQVRDTARTARAVVSADDLSAESSAELAIDRVKYRFQRGSVCLHEVEVEAKHEGSEETVERVIRSLLKENPSLRPWPYSKLATGIAIEALLAGSLEGVLTESDTLTAEGLRWIEAFLRSRG
jgi:inorganic triphosphatase YgiF